MQERFIGLLGIGVLFGIAWLFSSRRSAISFRIVGSAFALQAAIAAFVLYVPAGKGMIEALSGGVQAIVEYSGAGIDMVFGNLADANAGFSFAIRVLPIIIFFSALMSVLYHLHVMQLIVKVLGGAIQWIIGTCKVESLNAAANVFVGQTEAPLVVRPYLQRLSEPQLFAIMVSGVASVAGTVLAAYAQMGVRLDYLLAASFMAAPGGLLMAKMLMPDDPDEVASADDGLELVGEDMRHGNVILAAASGATDGVRLAVNIGAMLIAFVSLIALFNGLLAGVAGTFGVEGLTLERILGWVFSPLMFVLGVPFWEVQTAGALFGEKLILNEFVAFLHLGQVIETLSPKTEAIITFSLCGFANLSSIAILLGGLGSLIPHQRELIGRFGLKAVAAGSLSNLMSAVLAGLLLSF